MAKKDEQGNWINPRGRLVHESLVNKEDKRKERIMTSAFKKMESLEKQMRQKKTAIIKSVGTYMETLGNARQMQYKNSKGNLTLTSFSGDMQMEIKMSDVIEFNEKLKLAKQCFDEWIDEKLSKTDDKELVAVVNEAFSLDKKGKVNTQSLLRLRDLKIKGALWKRAIDLLTESISVASTREYLIMRKRDEATEKFQTINLNFSSI